MENIQTFKVLSCHCLSFHPLRYLPAGRIATVRNLLVAPEFAKLHPQLDQILRFSMQGGWKLFASWRVYLQIAQHD